MRIFLSIIKHWLVYCIFLQFWIKLRKQSSISYSLCIYCGKFKRIHLEFSIKTQYKTCSSLNGSFKIRKRNKKWLKIESESNSKLVRKSFNWNGREHNLFGNGKYNNCYNLKFMTSSLIWLWCNPIKCRMSYPTKGKCQVSESILCIHTEKKPCRNIRSDIPWNFQDELFFSGKEKGFIRWYAVNSKNISPYPCCYALEY